MSAASLTDVGTGAALGGASAAGNDQNIAKGAMLGAGAGAIASPLAAAVGKLAGAIGNRSANSWPSVQRWNALVKPSINAAREQTAAAARSKIAAALTGAPSQDVSVEALTPLEAGPAKRHEDFRRVCLCPSPGP